MSQTPQPNQHPDQTSWRGKIYVYCAKQDRGKTLVLWRVDDDFQIIKPQTPRCKSVAGKQDGEAMVYLARFVNVLPGIYGVAFFDEKESPFAYTSIEEDEEDDITEIDISAGFQITPGYIECPECKNYIEISKEYCDVCGQKLP